MKKLFQFAIYYSDKRFRVFCGFHRTRNPLSLRWRWKYWSDNYEEIRRKAEVKDPISKSGLKKTFSTRIS